MAPEDNPDLILLSFQGIKDKYRASPRYSENMVNPRLYENVGE